MYYPYKPFGNLTILHMLRMPTGSTIEWKLYSHCLEIYPEIVDPGQLLTLNFIHSLQCLLNIQPWAAGG
jgi:hypothetical protein